MPLLDQYGRPVRKAELRRPQAEARITSIRQPWHAGFASGLTPQRLASILRACDAGNPRDYMILAEEMEERDPHYASVLGVRKRAVSGVEPLVEPASESDQDKKIADAVREAIAEHPGFTDLVEDLLDGIGKGYSIVETIWETTAEAWRPARWRWRPQHHFDWDRETGQELRLLDEANPAEGVELHRFSYLIHAPKLKSGHPSRSGLARLVAFSWMCKSYSLKDWMAFAETYGLPLRIGKYGPEATKEDVEKLYMAVANIGTDAAAVIPDSMRIEFEQIASASAGERVFENLARYLDEQVSKAVLGQTMTSDNGSSEAQAKVHNEVRHDISEADARAVSGTLQRDMVRPFVDLNYGTSIDDPKLSIVPKEAEDTDMVLRHTKDLGQAGLTFKASEVRAKLGYSRPDPDDEIFGGGGSAQSPAAETARDRRQAQTARADPFDELDEIEEAMLEGWEPVMSETLDAILSAIEDAETLEEAMDKLAELDALPSSRLIEQLVSGMFTARALGDAQDG